MIWMPIIVSILFFICAYFIAKKRIGADRGSFGVNIINKTVYGLATLGSLVVFSIFMIGNL